MNIADCLIGRVTRRPQDFIVGDADSPQMLRWWVIPRNGWFNIYLHKFVRDDHDVALHDHMYFNVSIILRGRYVEHTIRAGGVHRRRQYTAGGVKARSPWYAHRIELVDGEPCWSLFITGPRIRQWGFHCPNGWRHWKEFIAPHSYGNRVGKGCE
jgi:hypothetical protein